MLKIQRASAGSGKTYALAKNFIFNLIARESESGKWWLRNERQIEDALQHILAITFTNKATNEMKQRIVSNLASLSMAASSEINEEILSSIPYLKEFHDILNVDYTKIGESAAIALRIILNNFSNFKISTIDSFFQEILHTFAYEANLNDNYQLEIDTSYITDAAIDAAFHELDTNPQNMDFAAFWLKILMKEESQISQSWNPFNKKTSSRSIYNKIRNGLFQLESENFKDIKEKLELYFNDQQNVASLTEVYKSLKEKAFNERNSELKEIKSNLDRVEKLIYKNDYPTEYFNKSFLSHLDKIRKLKINDTVTFSFNKIINDESVFLKKYRSPENELDIEALALYEKLIIWNNPESDSYYKNWTIYGDLLPYLGLIMEIKSFVNKILDTNNLIKLSDTSYILKKIIGEDDAPFVYERLGTRINHYLIDEFQDTSKLQWEVLYPLLNEGVANDKSSLIIGDPKQSIYRFRNADHKLITDVVPKAFPLHIDSGYSKEENTNWRSHTNIVKFNNYFFKTLAEAITERSKENGNATNFNNLYSNTVQYPHNQEGKGYIEIRFQNKKQDEDESDSFTTNEIGTLISFLLSRGYRPKDIGILVNTNSKGKEIVENLINYNESLEGDQPAIDFISEESLYISSSPAIELIIDVLKKIANPGFFHPQSNEKIDSNDKPKYLKWNDIKTEYKIYSTNNPGIDPAKSLMTFLEASDTVHIIPELISELENSSLTSLVEVIVKYLLSENIRKTEAIYIASFQDLVNEYSMKRSEDPASFLDWWFAKGQFTSISSPDGTDAVQIMTIHKSKGLEFKCVILPFVSDSFNPDSTKSEWRWVKPNSLEGLDFPPVLPVKTTSGLLNSIHDKIYKEYYDQILTDCLNKYYVAFTRACNELYILASKPSKNANSINDYIFYILTGKIIPPLFNKEEENDVLNINEVRNNIEENIITFGEPFTLKEIRNEYKREDEKNMISSNVSTKYFKDYYVNNKRPRLRSIASKVLPSGEFY